jgi:hypothetical protein
MQEDVNVEEVEEEGQEIEIIEKEQETDEVTVEAKDKPKSEDGDDLSEYSDSVKKRISKLTNRFREEERQRQAAVEYAEAVKKQNEELKTRIDKLDTTYVGEFDTRVQSQAIAAKEAYKKALEDGNADAMYDAQQNISRIAMEESKLSQLKADRETRAEQAKQPQTQQPQAQQPQAQPDPKAEDWAKRNTWFGQDKTMTYAAFGLHKELIEDEGFDATSDEYYTELNTRIRSAFPQKFQESPKKSNSPRVASAGTTASKSSTPKGRRTVKLTASQIAIARRLNVPLEEYAKYVKE